MKRKMSKADRVRQLDKAGFTVKQIAAKVGCSANYVYTLRYVDKARAKSASTGTGTGINVAAAETKATPVKRGRGRPRKVILASDTVTVSTPKLETKEESWKLNLMATCEAPKLTWGQRLSALFTGRV